jgi:YVTN family beta-propeller protein
MNSQRRALSAWPAEAAPFAYVANESSNTVSVIDTATNAVVATVTVGGLPLGVAVTPDGKHAYVANRANGTVSVIDTASNTVVATVTVGNGAGGAAVTPDWRIMAPALSR